MKYHYPQYQSLSHFHFSNSVAWSKSLFKFTYKNQHEFQHFNWFGGFWCVLCGTDLQWAQSTTEQLSEYPELDKNIAGSHSRDALSFFDCIPRTSDLNSQRWLQRQEANRFLSGNSWHSWSEYLFRTCSLPTSLVTSQSLPPLIRAVMLCWQSWIRIGSFFTLSYHSAPLLDLPLVVTAEIRRTHQLILV